MAKLTRYTQKIFGSSAGANNMGEFGSFAAGTPARYSGSTITPTIIQALSNYLGGWFDAIDGFNSPCIEDMNSLAFLWAYQLSYLFQQGIPEWDSGTTYYTGSLVNYGGVLWISLIDNNTSNLTVGTSWTGYNGAQAKSANFNVTVPCPGYICDVSGGSITASLPAVSSFSNNQYRVSFKNKSFGSSNTLTISPNGGDFIEGVNSSLILGAGEFVSLFCDASSWYIWNP